MFIVFEFMLVVGLERDGDLSNLASLLNGDEATSLKLFTDAHCLEGNCFFRKLISILYPWIIGDPPGGDISFKFPEVSTLSCLNQDRQLLIYNQLLFTSHVVRILPLSIIMKCRCHLWTVLPVNTSMYSRVVV